MFVFVQKNEIDQTIRENSGFIVSELVVGSGEQDFENSDSTSFSGSILSVTATDTSVLYDRRHIAKAKRHYGVLHLSKKRKRVWREQGARMVIAAIARAAARQDKVIELLLCGVKITNPQNYQYFLPKIK